MAASVFYIPSVNIIGSDSLSCAMDTMRDYGWRRALIVTDAMLSKLGMALIFKTH
jgi:alcohol dehydrogenase